MTTEEKAYAYDKVREEIAIRFGSNIADEIFSQFEKSEDERIRKALIDVLSSDFEKDTKIHGITVGTIIAWLEKQSEKTSWKPSKEEMDVLYGLAYITDQYDEHKEEVITRLYQDLKREFFNGATYENMFPSSPVDSKINIEKQGEQKPANKVESKFHEGDWIIHNKNNELANSLMLVTGKDNNAYLCKYKDGQCSYNIEFIDKEYRLWTIQDAKDGDILSWDDNKCIALFKNIYDEESFNSYGFVGHCTGTFELRQSYHDIEGVHPATKEQCDLLFSKIKEASYEWNSEKKELKKIEQKIPKFKTGDFIQYKGMGHNRYTINEVCGTTHYINSQGKRMDMSYTDENFEIVKHKPVEWSEEDEVRLDEAIRMVESNGSWVRSEDAVKLVSDWLKALKDRVQLQPKQEWSEEDEEIHRKCICSMRASACGFPEEEKFVEQVDNWIKSLKYKVQQSKQEWSEEDEKKLAELSSILEIGGNFAISDWLKSLRPQPNRVTDEELAQAEKDAYNDILDKIKYFSRIPSFGDGWSAAILYLKKRNAQPQNSWKPSEEEKAALRTAIHIMTEERNFPKLGEYLQNILNAFEGQSREEWKPSEEQMEILQYLCNTSSHPNEKVIPTLESLYNDLKKLMEE